MPEPAVVGVVAPCDAPSAAVPRNSSAVVRPPARDAEDCAAAFDCAAVVPGAPPVAASAAAPVLAPAAALGRVHVVVRVVWST